MQVSHSSGSGAKTQTAEGAAEPTGHRTSAPEAPNSGTGLEDAGGASRVAGPSSTRPTTDTTSTGSANTPTDATDPMLGKGGGQGARTPANSTSGMNTILNNIGGQEAGASGGDVIVHQSVVTVREIPTSSLLANEAQIHAQNMWSSPLDDLVRSVTTPDAREVLRNMDHISDAPSQASAEQTAQAQSATEHGLTAGTHPQVPENSPLANALSAASTAAQFDRISQAWLVSSAEGNQAFGVDGAYLGPEWLLGALSDLAQSSQSRGSQASSFEKQAQHANELSDSSHNGSATLSEVKDSAAVDTHGVKPSVEASGPPKDSEAGRMLSERDNGVRLGDPASCYRDAESGKWAMKGQDGTWQVFDKQGRFSGFWSAKSANRRQIKVGGKNRVSTEQQPFSCELWGECQREGLPSCCQFRGTL